jgi:hypothetical protein
MSKYTGTRQRISTRLETFLHDYTMEGRPALTAASILKLKAVLCLDCGVPRKIADEAVQNLIDSGRIEAE